MLISHWLIASYVVDVVMLLLSLAAELSHSIELFLKSTWWWKFYINFPLFHFSSIVVYIAMRTSGLKNIFRAYISRAMKMKQKIPNLWIVFHWNFPLYTFFMKNIFKSFIFHNSVAWLKIYQQLISKMHIKSSTTTLRWYPIKLFASFYNVSMSFTQLNAIIESPSRTSWINYAILHLRRG